MRERNVDYIIVGQGIAGSWLAFELIRRGHQIIIYNEETENSSTLKAGGLYNPITGKKFVKTWKADKLFPKLEDQYEQLEKELGARFIYKKRIYRPFPSIDVKNDWSGKMADDSFEQYVLKEYSGYSGIHNLQDHLGGIVLNYSGYVNLKDFIHQFRQYFRSKECYVSEKFNYEDINTKEDSVSYQGIKAKKILFCEGPFTGNPFWKDLPFHLVGGETMDVKIDLESDYIINQGVFMIPKEGFFTIGSTYYHQNLSYHPREEGILQLQQKLKKVYTGSCEIVYKRAGIRPATFDRRPFIGWHKENKTLGIFNGFGTKGVSLIPYFTLQFVDFIERKEALDKEVDVERVY